MASRIRILHCIHSLTSGGAERQMQLLVSVSHRHNMEPGVFCVNDKGNAMPQAATTLYKSSTTNRFNLGIFSSLNRAILDFRPNIIHTWLPASVTIPTMLLATLKQVPCVWSYRNAMFFNRPLTTLEYMLAWPCSARIISNNPVKRSSWPYRLLYRAKSGVEIRNAVRVDPKYRRPLPSHEAHSERLILFAGRITHQKNWRCLIQALPVVRRSHSVKLLVCGDGEERSQLTTLIDQLGLASCISLMGYRSDLHEIMQRADVLVLPSWYEGMSNVFLEALAIGLPCVVSNIPANLNIIEESECALTFNPSSPEELAACLLKLFDSQDLTQSLIQRGWKVAEKYALDRCAEEHAAVYRSILEPSSS